MGRIELLVVAIIAIAGCGRGGEGAKPRIVPPGAARIVDFPGALTKVLVEHRATDGAVGVLELRPLVSSS